MSQLNARNLYDHMQVFTAKKTILYLKGLVD